MAIYGLEQIRVRLVYYNPEKVFDDNLNAYRIKIPRNDGTGLADYMLGTESITSIAIDGANRKWLGTSQFWSISSVS